MFRLFENLVDPFVDYSETDIPPNKLYPFLKDYCRPFFGIFGFLIVLSCLVAGIEIGLIYFIGWLVDVMRPTFRKLRKASWLLAFAEKATPPSFIP